MFTGYVASEQKNLSYFVALVHRFVHVFHWAAAETHLAPLRRDATCAAHAGTERTRGRAAGQGRAGRTEPGSK